MSNLPSWYEVIEQRLREIGKRLDKEAKRWDRLVGLSDNVRNHEQQIGALERNQNEASLAMAEARAASNACIELRKRLEEQHATTTARLKLMRERQDALSEQLGNHGAKISNLQVGNDRRKMEEHGAGIGEFLRPGRIRHPRDTGIDENDNAEVSKFYRAMKSEEARVMNEEFARCSIVGIPPRDKNCFIKFDDKQWCWQTGGHNELETIPRDVRISITAGQLRELIGKNRAEARALGRWEQWP